MKKFIHNLVSHCWLQALILFAATTGTIHSEAACVNPNKPLESPAAGMEMFYDIHKFPGRWPRKITTSPYGLAPDLRAMPLRPESKGNDWEDEWKPNVEPKDDIAEEGFNGHRGYNDISLESDGRSPTIWPNDIDPTKADRKKLTSIGGVVYFYEPDGKGGRRVCRMERWISRHVKVGPGEGDKTIPRKLKITAPTSPNQARNPALAALGKDYVFIGYSNLLYNAQGLIPKIGPTCFYYTADGQVSWVAYESAKGLCIRSKPDPKKDSFIEVLFDAKGKGYGAVLSYPRKWSSDDDRTTQKESAKSDPNGWFQMWNFNYGAGMVIGYGNDRVGLTYIDATGSFGEKDDTIYHEMHKHDIWNPKMEVWQAYRQYEFPNAVSTDLLRHPETLYQYDRVRISGSGVRLFERFAAGSNKLTARTWRDPNYKVARQESFNADGKLVRAVAADYLDGWVGTPFAQENLAQYKSQIKVPFENIYLRVYDYDAKGKESLVGIGWTDYPREKYFEGRSGSRRDMLNRYKDAIAKALSRPFEKREVVPEELTYFFGTPDGKIKWKDYEAFNKEFGPFQDSDAVDVIFPTGRRSDRQ
jgi:hypothetical protein